MIDVALIVAGCLVSGYIFGRIHMAMRHNDDRKSLGAHLQLLVEYPHPEAVRKKLLLKLARGLIGPNP